jgi:hypothetical protein
MCYIIHTYTRAYIHLFTCVYIYGHTQIELDDNIHMMRYVMLLLNLI